MRWNGSDRNCKSIWYLFNLIQLLLLLFQKIWKVNFIHFFFKQFIFFFVLCSFIYFILIWFWFSNINLTNKQTNKQIDTQFWNTQMETRIRMQIMNHLQHKICSNRLWNEMNCIKFEKAKINIIPIQFKVIFHLFDFDILILIFNLYIKNIF